MDFQITQDTIRFTSEGFSFWFLCLKLLLCLGGIVFLLFGISRRNSEEEHRESGSAVNHPLILIPSGIFWFLVGVWIPAFGDVNVLSLDSSKQIVFLQIGEDTLSIPLSDIRSVFVLSPPETLEEDASEQGTPSLSLLTREGMEIVLGNLLFSQRKQIISQLDTSLDVPFVYDWNKIPIPDLLSGAGTKEVVWGSNQNLRGNWFGLVFSLYCCSLVYYFSVLRPRYEGHSFSGVAMILGSICFSLFVFYFSLKALFASYQLTIAKETIDLRVRMFGAVVEEVRIDKSQLAGTYLPVILDGNSNCQMYFLLKHPTLKETYQTILEDRWKGSFRFDEPGKFYKLDLCALPLSERHSLLKQLYR
ncbi:hypothetical protein [Leptospira idonii]|uniref:Uncharacterized protein n=1 Tax=Leptospira idonii TaxID=1193500 RepID=A0A4V3JY21_9LEPT|nr:hypothetical protein [Leptospira idonii]TGN18196.1 hypothetical protein EHS15_12340 [Leptospira idonii]